MLFNMAKDKTGLDINEIFKQQKERIESIENLKDEFGDLVKNAIDDAKASKLVVFIDDLDRLNPEVAVELLEVIKLFMDVENCVFVLAIDYDVVVSGVRRKYGQNVSEEKCRSFFDKIIQLPFRLPVESYQLQELLRETVSYDIDDDDIEPLANFVNDFIGFNPRAYKRLANSFFLIKNVNEELQKAKDQKSDNESSQKTRNVLIFGSLCIQMCTPEFYQLLISVSDETEFKSLRDVADIEALDKYLINQDIDLELDEKKKKNLLRCLKSFNEFLSDIQHNDTSESNIYNHLTSVLRMTAITSVTVADEQKERAKSIKIDQLFINGKEEKATTPTEAITKVFDQLLNDNRNLVDDYLEKNKTLLTVDKSKSESLFRNKKELFEHEGKMIYIGVSSGTDSKTKAICKLCNFLKNYGKEAHVIWKYQGESVFDSDIPIK